MGIIETTPAIILATYVVDNLGDMTWPVDGGLWPCYVNGIPDGYYVKSDCGCMYDMEGWKDGKFPTGVTVFHHGVQFRIRSVVHDDGWDMIEEIMSYLDGVHNETVTIGSRTCTIVNISRRSPIEQEIEKGTIRRYHFYVNLRLSYREVVT